MTKNFDAFLKHPRIEFSKIADLSDSFLFTLARYIFNIFLIEINFDILNSNFD